MPGRYDEPMRLTDSLLTLLASARLSRLVITDDIGRWWIKDPVDRAMDRYAATELERAAREHRDPIEPRWWKYRSGLDCPWCGGFWLGGLLLLGHSILPRPIWRGVAGALALNYAASHLGGLLGDFDSDDEEPQR